MIVKHVLNNIKVQLNIELNWTFTNYNFFIYYRFTDRTKVAIFIILHIISLFFYKKKKSITVNPIMSTFVKLCIIIG